jgi:hypothetical protein
MRLDKFFKIMGALTILALTYIHLQMQIIDLAYAGNKKEQRIKKLIVINGSTTYKILMLKSANHLGDTILEDGSDMQFADTDDVVRIVASPEFFAEKRSVDQSQLVNRASSFLNFLSFGLEAEAQSAE